MPVIPNLAGYRSNKRSGEDYRIDFEVQQSDLIANNAMSFVAPMDGYVNLLTTVVDKAITTGGTVTVRTSNGSVATPPALTQTVGGLTQTIANAAAKRTTQTTIATSGDQVTTKVTAGDIIELVFAGFATAGSINGHIRMNSAQFNT